MSEPLIITISGMRGIVSENLTDAVAAEYGSSFGTFLKKGRGKKAKRPSVCIGRDSRPSGPMLMSAVAAGLCAALTLSN
jgi:phosphomannomutase